MSRNGGAPALLLHRNQNATLARHARLYSCRGARGNENHRRVLTRLPKAHVGLLARRGGGDRLEMRVGEKP